MKKTQKIEWLTRYYKDNGLPIEEINLIGIRNSADIEKDVINDLLGYFTGRDIFLCHGTTEPSVLYTTDRSLRNRAGTFHLSTGFHRGIWCIGKHRGYEALVNDYRYCPPTRGWRDSNYNFTKDPADVEVCDYFGINFHRMHPLSIVNKIGKYSAGCQVIQSPADFAVILDKIKSSDTYKIRRKATFNYMLFNAAQLPQGFDGSLL